MIIAHLQYVVNEGATFTFLTNLNAPNKRLINFDLSKPEPQPVELLPEKEDVLLSIYPVNKNMLLVNYMHDCKVIRECLILY